MSYELIGFNTIEVYRTEGGFIALKQLNWSEHGHDIENLVLFPPSQLDSLIAYLNRVKKEIDESNIDE